MIKKLKKVLDLNPKLAAKESNSVYDIEAAMNLIPDLSDRGKAIRKANGESEMKQAVCLLIENDDGEYLGVARRDDHDAFGLPGGKVDPGESPIEAAVRELKEETGIVTTVDCLTEVYKSPCDGETPYESTTYSVSYWIGKPTQGDAGPVKWVSRSTLEEGPFGKYNEGLFISIDEG